VYSIALRYSGDESTAMDIAQDTFVKLYSSIRSFRGESTSNRGCTGSWSIAASTGSEESAGDAASDEMLDVLQAPAI